MTTTPPRRHRIVTSTSRIILARVRSRAGLIAGIAAAIALSMGLVCGVFAATHLETTAAIRAAMPAPDGPDGWLQLQTRPAADREAQDAAAEDLFARYVGDVGVVQRVLLGEPGSDLERVAWRVIPDSESLDADAVQTLARGLADLPAAFRESDAAESGGLASGGLPDAVATVAQGVRAAAAMAPVPLAILAVLAWFAVLQLARLLGISRGREAVLLRARGLAPAQAVPLAMGEAVAVTIAGGIVGLGAAAAWLASAWGPSGILTLASAWPLALGGAAALAATLTVGQLRASLAAERTDSAAGRIARAASPGAAMLLVLVAAVLIWQARASATIGDTWGTAVTTLAPTVGIAAVAVLAVLLFGPLSTAIARAAARRPRLAPGYPARQVARRVASFSVAVALVTIAVSGAAIAGSYAATWHETSQNSARVQAGAPLRAHVDPVTPTDITAAADASGVAGPAPVVTTAITAGEVAGSLVAISQRGMTDVLYEVPGAADPADLAESLATETEAVPFPEGATGLQITTTVAPLRLGGTVSADIAAWLMDESGLPVFLPLPADNAPIDGGEVLTAVGELPSGGPWRLVAVEFSRGPDVDLVFTDIAVDAVTSAGTVAMGVDPVDQLRLAPGGSAGVSSALASALVWSAGGLEPARVPVAVTAAFADQLGLAVGDNVDVRFDGSGRTVGVQVRSIADALPGVGVRPGILGPLGALVENQLPSRVTTGTPAPAPPLPNELWATGDDAAAHALADSLGALVTTPADPAAAVTGWVVAAWNTAAVGGALLAGVALVALLTALSEQRAGEVLVLRALGIAPPAQSRMRSAETGLVTALAGVLGLVGGILLAVLLVPGLVARAVPGIQLPATPALDPWPLVISALVIAAAWGVAAAGAAAAVRTQAASTRLEEAAA